MTPPLHESIDGRMIPKVVRVLALSSMVGVFGLAGLVLAQERLIVDPWAKPPAAIDRAGSRSVADGAVLPPLPPESSPLWEQGWSDPPTTSPEQAVSRPRPRRVAPSAGPVPARLAAVAWAKPLDMIVDPWQSGEKAVVARDFAIVDPWLR